MSKTSKTARASMVIGPVGKTVISDEVYVKNLRNDVGSGLYVAQEGAKALLRSYDAALITINELNEHVNNLEADKTNSENLIKDLIANNEKLKAEIVAAQAIFGTTKFTETSVPGEIEGFEAEAKNNHD